MDTILTPLARPGDNRLMRVLFSRSYAHTAGESQEINPNMIGKVHSMSPPQHSYGSWEMQS